MEAKTPNKRKVSANLNTIYEQSNEKSSFKGLDCSLLGIHESGIIENFATEESPIKEDLYSGFGRWK